VVRAPEWKVIEQVERGDPGKIQFRHEQIANCSAF
jgi:hypothetical protein